jgi:hypothetical protein
MTPDVNQNLPHAPPRTMGYMTGDLQSLQCAADAGAGVQCQSNAHKKNRQPVWAAGPVVIVIFTS